jgi:hypothetical protein
MSELVSFGGGVNSAALVILLVNEGWRGPIVYADTEADWPETACWMGYFERDWLKPRGLEITVLRGEWRKDKRIKDRGLIEFCEFTGMVPFPATRWCTQIFKIEPVNAWAEAHGITIQLIGIAADEAHRQKGRPCPLIDRGITRQGCIDIIQAEGLDVPQKSGCTICPFQRDSQWRELWHRHPDLFERAARLEESVPRTIAGRTRATLDPSGRVTLRDRQYRYEHQGSLLDEAAWDELLAYRPCVCGL